MLYLPRYLNLAKEVIVKLEGEKQNKSQKGRTVISFSKQENFEEGVKKYEKMV